MGSRNKKKQKRDFEHIAESDETFSFIAGYTSWGNPYGITWEQLGITEEKIVDDELPF